MLGAPTAPPTEATDPGRVRCAVSLLHTDRNGDSDGDVTATAPGPERPLRQHSKGGMVGCARGGSRPGPSDSRVPAHRPRPLAQAAIQSDLQDPGQEWGDRDLKGCICFLDGHGASAGRPSAVSPGDACEKS